MTDPSVYAFGTDADMSIQASISAETPEVQVNIHVSDAGKDGTDGKDGYTPVRGVDYWTEEDQQAIVDQISASVASGIENTASGDAISVNDSLEAPLRGLKLFGRTAQDGTPTPEVPVDLVSAGDDGDIGVTVAGAAESQSAVFSTPDGLPGIPVSSGGNYIDASGQWWVSDEIDFARGAFVQRVGRVALDGTEAWYKSTLNSSAPGNILRFRVDNFLPANVVSGSSVVFPGFCSHFVPTDGNTGYMGKNVGIAMGSTGTLNIFIEKANVSEFKAWLSGQYSAGTPVTVYYILPEPVETGLAEEDLAAYAALHTSKPATTVINDSGAGMQISYAADTKAYIDNKFAELAAVLAAKA